MTDNAAPAHCNLLGLIDAFVRYNIDEMILYFLILHCQGVLLFRAADEDKRSVFAGPVFEVVRGMTLKREAVAFCQSPFFFADYGDYPSLEYKKPFAAFFFYIAGTYLGFSFLPLFYRIK